MFACPRYVIKEGQVVVKQGKVVKSLQGKTYYLGSTAREGIEEEIREDFEKLYTVSWANYPVQDAYLPRGEVVPC